MPYRYPHFDNSIGIGVCRNDTPHFLFTAKDLPASDKSRAVVAHPGRPISKTGVFFSDVSLQKKPVLLFVHSGRLPSLPGAARLSSFCQRHMRCCKRLRHRALPPETVYCSCCIRYVSKGNPPIRHSPWGSCGCRPPFRYNRRADCPPHR